MIRDIAGSNTKLIELEVGVVTEEERKAARLTVCDTVQDIAQARELLLALGLLP